MKDTIDSADTPEVNISWHKKLWAGKTDIEDIRTILSNPKIAKRIDQLCLDELGATVDAINYKHRALFHAVNTPSALLALGVARGASSWATDTFSGKPSFDSVCLDVAIVRDGLNIARKVETISTIAIETKSRDAEYLSKAGAEVVSTWLNTLPTGVSAALRLRLEATGDVIQANGNLDPVTSAILVEAYSERLAHAH